MRSNIVIRFLSGTPALNLCLCSAFRLSYTETCGNAQKSMVIIRYCDNRLLRQIACCDSLNQSYHRFVDSIVGNNRFRSIFGSIDHNMILVLVLTYNYQLLIHILDKYCKLFGYCDKSLIATLLAFPNSVKISEDHCNLQILLLFS